MDHFFKKKVKTSASITCFYVNFQGISGTQLEERRQPLFILMNQLRQSHKQQWMEIYFFSEFSEISENSLKVCNTFRWKPDDIYKVLHNK